MGEFFLNGDEAYINFTHRKKRTGTLVWELTSRMFWAQSPGPGGGGPEMTL